jgi:hypothetical protein
LAGAYVLGDVIQISPMTTAERIKELRQKIKHIKKTQKGRSRFLKIDPFTSFIGLL